MARMEAGLRTLHLLDSCLGHTVAAKGKGLKPLRQLVLQTLYEQGSSLHDVWASIEEHAKLQAMMLMMLMMLAVDNVLPVRCMQGRWWCRCIHPSQHHSPEP